MKRVLVVEDHPLNQKLLRDVLMHAGYEAITAESALAGLDLAGRERPDLVLMDIQLPDVDGLEATRRLKSSPDTAHMPVVVVTAHAMPGDEGRARAAGADAYVSKPIDYKTLLATIADLLRTGPEPS